MHNSRGLAGILAAAILLAGCSAGQEGAGASSGAEAGAPAVQEQPAGDIAQGSGAPEGEAAQPAQPPAEEGDGPISEGEADRGQVEEVSGPQQPDDSDPPVQEVLAPSGDWALRLVNQAHPLQEELSVQLEEVEGGFLFDSRAAGALRQMVADARAAGHDVMLISTYRSFARSAYNYNQKVQQLMQLGYSQEQAEQEAARWIAPAGQSEHNTGLAVDLVTSGYWNRYGELEHVFEEDPLFDWLQQHCAEYGFILRYPKDKQEITGITYEPWHYRYVGVEAAQAISGQGLCLEEYLGQVVLDAKQALERLEGHLVAAGVLEPGPSTPEGEPLAWAPEEMEEASIAGEGCYIFPLLFAPQGESGEATGQAYGLFAVSRDGQHFYRQVDAAAEAWAGV